MTPPERSNRDAELTSTDRLDNVILHLIYAIEKCHMDVGTALINEVWKARNEWIAGENR